jgi:serine/threonine protein kinase
MNLHSSSSSSGSSGSAAPTGLADSLFSSEIVLDLPELSVKELAQIRHCNADGSPAEHKTFDLQNQPPALFGRYRLVKIIGKGGMGSVYLAEDTQLGRSVALKIPHLTTDGKLISARFQREAQAAATVTHPNICPLYDVGDASGVPYLIMAYIEGKPLSTHGQQMDDPAIIAMVRKLALAMHEAHLRGVVHRDLKPANVLIDCRGEPIITDFGIAWLKRLSAAITLPGTAWGTPTYMAPEVINGTAEAGSPSCDIYALGVILYELLTGQPPFSGEPSAVLYQAEFATPQPPSQLRPDLAPKLEAVCLKAMAKNVEDRYATMAELASALANVDDTSDTEPIVKQSQRKPSTKKPALASSVSSAEPARPRVSQAIWAVGFVSLSVVGVLGARSLFDNSPGYGTIEIKLSVGDTVEEVRVDGKLLSREEIHQLHKLEAGMHWLSVAAKDTESAPIPFRVEKGQNTTLYPSLPAKAVKLPPAPPVKVEPKEEPPPIAPNLLSPADQVMINAFPRNTQLTWTSVPGAVKYRVQVQCSAPIPGADWFDLPYFLAPEYQETPDTVFRFEFVGRQPGRWRVWAVDNKGREGARSIWRYFDYVK